MKSAGRAQRRKGKILAAWPARAKNLYLSWRGNARPVCRSDPDRVLTRGYKNGRLIRINASLPYLEEMPDGTGCMILFQNSVQSKKIARNLTLTAFALALAACAPVDENDAIGSHLAQPPAGVPVPPPIEANDIAIVGQQVASGIMNLPAIADAPVPPMVQFTEVTSIMDKPIDTEPDTQLLRDRLLLLTREKLRFVERTLPPLVLKKGKKAVTQPVAGISEPDYEILAELRGHVDAEFYKIQVQFVDIHSSQVLFDGLYRIRKEAVDQPPPATGNYGNNPAPRKKRSRTMQLRHVT